MKTLMMILVMTMTACASVPKEAPQAQAAAAAQCQRGWQLVKDVVEIRSRTDLIPGVDKAALLVVCSDKKCVSKEQIILVLEDAEKVKDCTKTAERAKRENKSFVGLLAEDCSIRCEAFAKPIAPKAKKPTS